MVTPLVTINEIFSTVVGGVSASSRYFLMATTENALNEISISSAFVCALVLKAGLILTESGPVLFSVISLFSGD